MRAALAINSHKLIHGINSAGITKTQYTIRSIPPKVDQALRKRAKSTGKSLNEVVLEALAKGTGLSLGTVFDDLDWFIGGRALDAKSFDDAKGWLNNLPKDI